MQRLLVVSHVRHYRHQGRLYAYGPYVREIDIWADLFPEVVIAAPCREGLPPGDCLPYGRENITITPVRETGGRTISAKLNQLLCLPLVTGTLVRAMRQADAVHVRCPGNLGLLGILLGPLLCRHRVAKYAGQWNGYPQEAWSVRLQRRLLKSRWWNSPVTVYGQWPNQPSHVHSFFTSMMTDDQVARAVEVAEGKCTTSPLRVMFSGRLVREKGVDVVLEAARLAVEDHVELEVRIVGDGPMRAELERRAQQAGIAQRVTFTGAVSYEAGLRCYEWADCLVLPSVSEGWPKVIAEAMCHGLVCIGLDRGQVGSMLAGRGIVLDDANPQEIARHLAALAREGEAHQEIRRRASLWARQYSLEGLRGALRELLERTWDVRLRPAPHVSISGPLSPHPSGILSS